ncbi:MAG: D-cysteine desulfhydrase family protein, partial [Candidatus Korarchaeota archaeon]|nr:D-cysteine desulfhydrase family protein [Candidatus Korarchaeota archaeon]
MDILHVGRAMGGFWRVYGFPRFKLASFPTPLEHAERLGEKLGIDLYVKRDDVMELALGGNKVRKLEFLVGDALAQGADTLITTGAFHSNHARLTAAAGVKAGLKVYLVLTPPGSMEPQGNLLLDMMLGAEIVPAEGDAGKAMAELAVKLFEEGRRPYVIPAGGASPIGVLGYVDAALELLEQMQGRGKKPRYIVMADGSCAMHAGMLLGLRLLGAEDVEVVGISVGRDRAGARRRVEVLVSQASGLLGVDNPVRGEDVVVFDEYVFGRYGAVTREVVETMKMAARTEALVLDPVYT